MNAIASLPLVVEDDASEFLRRNNLEDTFHQVCDLIRQCYPEILNQRAELWDDVDEPDLQYVLIVSQLPSNHPIERYAQQREEYDRRLETELPQAIWIHIKHRPWFTME